jgi:DNA-binding HxlR family transcriptional regulator
MPSTSSAPTGNPADARRCAVEVTVAVIGGKWKPIILFHLMKGTLRFGELHRRLPQVGERVLTRQLRELEADRLVLREIFAEVPPRVEYRLSDTGRSLIPVLETMSRWGDVYGTAAGAAMPGMTKAATS